MRIIAGTLGGRQFDSPKSIKTHPMSDKMRGALFNILGDIAGLSVLDPFAGTGAFSFEAISRGAASALAIEQDKLAQRVIDENIITLGLSEQIKLIKASGSAWLQTNPEQRFDLVLCDPPYTDLQLNLLARLTVAVVSDGLFVLSWPASKALPSLPAHMSLLDHRTYGDASLAFYRQTQ